MNDSPDSNNIPDRPNVSAHLDGAKGDGSGASRRDFIATACCACGAGALGLPALASLLATPPQNLLDAKTASAGTLAISHARLAAGELKGPGKPKLLTLQFESLDGWRVERREMMAFAVREGSATGPIRVFSALCPHAGCNVAFDGKASQFVCPCHDARFSPDGARVAGPAKRGLYELESRLTERGLEVWPTAHPLAQDRSKQG